MPQAGYYVKGIHKGMIEENLFKQVQEMLEENLRKKKFVKAKCFKEEFMLSGFIKCEKCGSNITGSSSRSKNGWHHHLLIPGFRTWIVFSISGAVK